MATGYDNRQPTRQSFAFKPQAAVQIDPRSQASSVNVGTRSGGENTGGGRVIQSENPVLGGNAGATLPAFLDQVFEPYVQEQQRKRMIEGATAYMNGKTMEQIADERPWLSNIFGPTDYHSGAATSAMLTQVQRWKQSTLENMDEIKKLPENQVAGYIYNSAEQFATGDSLTDSLMFQEVIKSTAELVPVVATERYKWEQETALVNTVGLWDNTARSFEQVAARTAKLEDPSLQDAEWLNNFQNGLLSNLAKPAGMAEETYRSGMQQFYRSQIVAGNFHTVGVIRNSGFLEALPLEDRNRLETFYETQSTKRLTEAVTPYLSELMELDYDVARGAANHDQLIERMQSINSIVQRETGIEKPFFDATDIRATGKSLTTRIVAMSDEARRRIWTQAENDRNREATAEAKAQADEIDASEARSMVQAGTINAAKAAGVEEGLMSRAQYTEVFNRGDYSSIAKAYADSQWVSPLVKSTLNTRLQSSLGGWSDTFEAAYREFVTIRDSGQGGQAAVAAIYGDNLTNLQRYDQLMRAGNVSRERAYQETFGAPTMRVAPLTPQRRTDMDKGIDDLIGRLQGNGFTRIFNGGQFQLTESAKANIRAVIAPGASAALAAISDLDGGVAAEQQLARALENRELEIVGSFAWRNARGGSAHAKSFEDMVGGTKEEVGRELGDLVTERLQAAGVPIRDSGFVRPLDAPWTADRFSIDMTVARLPDENGNARLYVSTNHGGVPKEVIITSADLTARIARNTDTNAANRAYVQWLATPDGRSMARGSGSSAEQRARFTQQFRAGNPNPSGLPDGMRRRNPQR
ncbi:conserved hypothetical protein [Caulobacter phage Cd1]|uniref:Internal virion protein n=1 Tax=Caulobacter phage Cd1 TaxID=718008 RepID=F1ADS0_9CAUD|nr:conserved hypothetical protein [Caulobacter phage Cd1]